MDTLAMPPTVTHFGNMRSYCRYRDRRHRDRRHRDRRYATTLLAGALLLGLRTGTHTCCACRKPFAASAASAQRTKSAILPLPDIGHWRLQRLKAPVEAACT